MLEISQKPTIPTTSTKSQLKPIGPAFIGPPPR
jgi:hypothetical protein